MKSLSAIRFSLINLVAFVGFATHANPHQHDHGQLLVSQEGADWHLEFTLPAINVFGFEHKPQNQAHHKKIESFVNLLKDPSQVLSLGELCKTTSSVEHISSQLSDRHHQSEHEHDEHEHSTHMDVKFEYQFKCNAKINDVKVRLFPHLAGLEQLSVMWVTDKKQGATTLTPTAPTFSIN